VWKAAEKTAWPFGPAIRLLTLTAARREEIGALRWSEIHGDEIRVPGERSKSGEPRVIPLSPAAAELIKSLPRHGEHVFTTNGTTAISGWAKAKRALDAAAAEFHGQPLEPWRVHDIRRTAATGLQRLGVGLQVIESVLGHIGGSRAGVVGVYQRHRFDAEKRSALEAWAREIERIAGSKRALTAEPLTMGGPTLGRPTLVPIDTRWLKAIERADRAGSLDPLIEYLRLPGVALGSSECWWLRQLLERIQFKRKKGGRYVPLGQKSRKEIHETGAAHVRDLQQTEKLSREAAIDAAVQIYPAWFGADAGASLANFMKRGPSRS
jgi:integrase-like protein